MFRQVLNTGGRAASREARQFAPNFAQGAASEAFSQGVLGRDAPMAGKPSVGGGIGSVVVKSMFQSVGKTPPKGLSATSFEAPAATASPSADPASGDGPSWLVIGLVIAGVAVTGYGAYRLLKKAQDIQAGAAGGGGDDDGLGEIIGALISDPSKMSAFKSQLRKELADTNYPQDEIGKEVARIVGNVRKAAKMPDTIPADVSELFGKG